MKKARFALLALSLMWLGAHLSGCAGNRAVTAKRAPEAQPVTEHHEVYFEFNHSEVRDEDEALLDDIASKIQGDEKAVAILEGHADQIGENVFNEILAESRARAVRVYLRDQGADARRLTVISKGEREPLVQGRSQKELLKNRRVEVILTLTRKEEKEQRDGQETN